MDYFNSILQKGYIYTLILFIILSIIFNVCLSSKQKEIEKLNQKNDILTNEIDSLNKQLKQKETETNNLINDRCADCVYEMKLIEPLKQYDKKEYYILYKKIVKRYADILDEPETIYDYYSDEEINYIGRCVETECHGCSFDAKVNVANVLFNRVESDKFSDDMITNITSPNQFAYHKKNIEDDTLMAVEYAYAIEDTTQGALYFHSNKKTNKFNGADYIFSDDAVHHFYK